MPDDPKKVLTPNDSGSFSAFHDECVRIAKRLREAAIIKSTADTPSAGRDPLGAYRAEKLAVQADQLAAQFAAWPRLPPGDVATVRGARIAELLELNGACEAIARSTPGMTVLPPKFPPPRPGRRSRPPPRR